MEKEPHVAEDLLELYSLNRISDDELPAADRDEQLRRVLQPSDSHKENNE